MNDFDPNNFSHQYFRRLDEKMDRMLESQSDLKSRMSNVEEHLGFIMTSIGGLNKRMDRFEERMGRMERRLDLHDNAVAETQSSFEGPKR
ncbi:hypothetical protein [uncultured Algimonas sp.]|uniref:hypothetical protein n=1 Tax=uncultured Algimonas sp. TaxID=1547920 RepID=UPI0026379806|nr:hypothetical protein [uncultured Algimonas sp.]